MILNLNHLGEGGLLEEGKWGWEEGGGGVIVIILVAQIWYIGNMLFSFSWKKGKEPKTPSGSFTNDVVLLARPEEEVVPRNATKHYLAINGHVLYGCTFRKEWNSQQVLANLRSLFPVQLKDNVKYVSVCAFVYFVYHFTWLFLSFNMLITPF